MTIHDDDSPDEVTRKLRACTPTELARHVNSPTQWISLRALEEAEARIQESSRRQSMTGVVEPL